MKIDRFTVSGTDGYGKPIVEVIDAHRPGWWRRGRVRWWIAYRWLRLTGQLTYRTISGITGEKE